MTTSIPRRRIVSMIGVAMLSPLAATPALAEELAPTPRSTEGPFYPRSLPADSDADLTRVAGRAGRAMGTPLELSGRVLDRSGKPRFGARVEIWQCDASGRYHHVGDDASLDATPDVRRKQSAADMVGGRPAHCVSIGSRRRPRHFLAGGRRIGCA